MRTRGVPCLTGAIRDRGTRGADYFSLKRVNVPVIESGVDPIPLQLTTHVLRAGT